MESAGARWVYTQETPQARPQPAEGPLSVTVHLSPLLSSQRPIVFTGSPYQDPRQMKVFVMEGWLRVLYFLCIVFSLFIVWLSRSFFQPKELHKLKEK